MVVLHSQNRKKNEDRLCPTIRTFHLEIMIRLIAVMRKDAINTRCRFHIYKKISSDKKDDVVIILFFQIGLKLNLICHSLWKFYIKHKNIKHYS